MNQAIGGSSSISLTQGAQSEAQPFFTARIFPLSEQVASSSSSSSASTSSPLSALRLSLLAEWQRFHSAPLPHGAGGYVFYHSSPHISAHPGAAPSSKNKHPLPPHLTFDLRTGSATEDEFLLVHFLRLQQRRGALLERCAIQLKDEDGDFLLIEAAEELEDWIDPDNAPGRSWLLKEQLVIIPPYLHPSDDLDTPGPLEDIALAIKYLDEQDDLLRPSETLNAAAFARLSSYPTTEWLDTIQHRTTVYLPSRQTANILEQNPRLISRAGQAFLGRDTQDMRRASRMDKFLPVEEPQKGQVEETPTELFVLPITLPRRLYAQLLSARFLPPKTFPSPYRDRMSHFWRIIDGMSSLNGEGGAETAKEVDAAALDDGRRYDLGCKLVLGLEMAFCVDRERFSTLSRSKGGSIFNSRAGNSETETSLSGPAYEAFLSKLSQLGFFQDEIRGSAKWKELEAQAIRDWGSGSVVKDEDVNDTEDDDASELAWVQNIDQLSAVSTSSQAILATVQPAFAVLEQSDSWLYDGGASFLEQGGQDDLEAEEEASRRLNDFASKVEKFVQGKGEVHGAVVDESDSEEEGDDGSEGDVDSEAVVSQAREELNRLTPAEREAKLSLLLPRLGQPVEWGDKSVMELDDEAADPVEQSQEVEAAISDIDEQPTKEQAFQEATKIEPLPKILDSSSRQALSSDALRASMQQQAFKSNNKFDGAESFHLDAISDDDSEAGLDENGQPETKETRQKRAELLGLDWEEDEEENFEAEQNPSRRRRLDEVEEMQEFLEFARQELGLSEAQLHQILNDRKESGRWVPGMEQEPPQKPVKSVQKSAASTDQGNFGKGFSKGFLATKVSEPRSTPATPQPGSKKVTFADASAENKPSVVTDKADSQQEPTLDSFDSLMAAMDSSLDAHRRAKGLPPLDRQQAYGGEVTAEDWALRRPGGASLGSVMMKQQQEGREKSAKPEDVAPPATKTVPVSASEEDMADDEDLEPLSAKDEDKLHRLLAGQDEKKETFDEMVESARRQRRDRGATGPSILDTTDAFERPEAAKITELFHNSDGAKEGDDEEMPDLEVDSDAEMEGDDGMNEKVMGNLLESWRAQGGNAGPMSTLAGGMGFGTQAPR